MSMKRIHMVAAATHAGAKYSATTAATALLEEAMLAETAIEQLTSATMRGHPRAASLGGVRLMRMRRGLE